MYALAKTSGVSSLCPLVLREVLGQKESFSFCFYTSSRSSLYSFYDLCLMRLASRGSVPLLSMSPRVPWTPTRLPRSLVRRAEALCPALRALRTIAPRPMSGSLPQGLSFNLFLWLVFLLRKSKLQFSY